MISITVTPPTELSVPLVEILDIYGKILSLPSESLCFPDIKRNDLTFKTPMHHVEDAVIANLSSVILPNQVFSQTPHQRLHLVGTFEYQASINTVRQKFEQTILACTKQRDMLFTNAEILKVLLKRTQNQAPFLRDLKAHSH
jgi:hypothetical protein